MKAISFILKTLTSMIQPPEVPIVVNGHTESDGLYTWLYSDDKANPCKLQVDTRAMGVGMQDCTNTNYQEYLISPLDEITDGIKNNTICNGTNVSSSLEDQIIYYQNIHLGFLASQPYAMTASSSPLNISESPFGLCTANQFTPVVDNYHDKVEQCLKNNLVIGGIIAAIMLGSALLGVGGYYVARKCSSRARPSLFSTPSTPLLGEVNTRSNLILN